MSRAHVSLKHFFNFYNKYTFENLNGQWPMSTNTKIKYDKF